MAIAPKHAAQVFTAGSSPPAVHTVELFLDYVCPFSAKMFNTVYSSVLPTVKAKYAHKVRFIFRQQIQPWHPSSTLVHEAGAAVMKLSPDKFWQYSAALFMHQTEYFDIAVVNETRNATYQRLAQLAAKSVDVDEHKMLDLLRIPEHAGPDGQLNAGNAVTSDIKTMVKVNRRLGVHVTPTVLFNGIEEGSISSGFSGDDWIEWLQKNVT